MIGIDIVDIKDPLLHPRTADHLRFIKAKGDQYPENIDPILLYWIVWSAKEAIFKSKRQLKSFDPKLITVVFSNNLHFSSKQLSGTVESHTQLCSGYGRTTIDGTYASNLDESSKSVFSKNHSCKNHCLFQAFEYPLYSR